MDLIKVENISLRYDSNIIIKNLSFKVEEGDYLYIVGNNGAGKSTLIGSLLGLLKPYEGKFIFDKSIKQTEIGYLPQMTIAQKNFPASCYEVVLSGFLNSRGIKPTYTKQNKLNAISNMMKLNIGDLKHKCFNELSGGQQRRVLLARALCATKKVLVLDEPISSLDPKATKEFYELIKKLNEEENITIIMISHDIKSAITYGKHVLHITGDDPFFGTEKEYKKRISEYFLVGDEND